MHGIYKAEARGSKQAPKAAFLSLSHDHFINMGGL